jgi:hypothetical protein
MAKVAIDLHYLEFDDYCTLEVVVGSPLVVMRRGFLVEAWQSVQEYTLRCSDSGLSQMTIAKRVSLDELMFVALTPIKCMYTNVIVTDIELSSSCFPCLVHPPELSGALNTSALYDVQVANDMNTDLEFFLIM